MPGPSSARSVASVACRGAASSATSGPTGCRSRSPSSVSCCRRPSASCSRSSSPGSPRRSWSAAIRAGLDRLVVILFLLFCVQAVGSFLQTYLLGVVGERVVAQLRGELFGRLVTLSLDFHSGHRVGELISRLSNDVTIVRTMLTQTVTSLLSSVIGLVGSVIILFTLSPSLLFIVLLLAPALIVVAVLFGRPLQRVSTQVQDTIARSTTTAEEALSGIRVVKSYVREEWELERYDVDLRSTVATGSRLALWRASFGALMGLPRVRCDRRPALVHGSPGHRRNAERRNADRIPAVRRRDRGKPRVDRGPVRPVPRGDRRDHPGLRDHRYPSDDPRRPGCHPMPSIAGQVTLDDVSFGYRPDRLVLHDISLEIPAGETLALVGPSGSGKTTLVGLLPRLWDVTSGTIRIDGIDIRGVTVASLREHIGLVAQEPTLFGGTIRENILYGRLDATEAEMIAAAQAANATTSSASCPTATTRSSATAASACRAASASAWRSPG